MIHASISEDRASLVQGMSRAVLIFDMTLDADLEVQQAVVRSDQINVAYRLSYQDIPLVLADSEHAAQPSLAAATQLTSRLLAKRRNKVALAFYDMAQLIMTDEEGNLRRQESQEAMIGNILVQELMIMANTQAGLNLFRQNIPDIGKEQLR